MSESATAERIFRVGRDRVWSLLVDPALHHRFDATGMVGSLATKGPRGVGDVFRMNMTYTGGGAVERYQSDNHVVRYEPGQVIAWATALPDGEPLGWIWTYELSDDSGGTRVRLTYDWTHTSPENRRRFGVPLTDEAGLGTSLELLERASRTS